MAKLNKDIENQIKEFKGQEHKGMAEGFEWKEQELAAKAGTPLIDPAVGKKIIIRKFEFEWKKGIKTEERMNAQYNKQEFFNSHAKYIKDFLWKDGLSILENQDPKMIFNNKGYVIVVATEARWGVSIFDKPTTLQQIMKPFAKKK